MEIVLSNLCITYMNRKTFKKSIKNYKKVIQGVHKIFQFDQERSIEEIVMIYPLIRFWDVAQDEIFSKPLYFDDYNKMLL